MTRKTRPANPAALGRQNAAAVMRAVLAEGPVPRMRIAGATGLSGPTVTRLTSRLTGAGLLTELPGALGPSESGRPRVPLDIARKDLVAAGMHIGKLRTTAGLADPRGDVVAQVTAEHASDDPVVIVAQAGELLSALMTGSGCDTRLLGVGLSVGGWFDTEAGIVVDHPALGWSRVPLGEMFAREMAARLPDTRFWLDGLVRATALAESWHGAASKAGSVVEFFIGNVVGAAFVFERAIHAGPRSAAGNMTHLSLAGARAPECSCGRRNCLQVAVTDEAVLRTGVETGSVQPGEAIEDVIARARAGDRAAANLLRTRARRIGQAAAILLDLVNPDVVVLAGGGATAAPEYFSTSQRELVRCSQLGAEAADRLVLSGLGGHPLVSASAALVLDAFYADPLGAVGLGADDADI